MNLYRLSVATLALAAACASRARPVNEPGSRLDEPDHATLAAPPPPPRFVPTAFEVTVHGTGRPMILVPGLMCGPGVWDEVVAHGGYEHHTLALAGFAGRPSVPAPLFPAIIADLAAYIRDRKLEHPIIVGHSMGGTLAMQFALEYPDLVGAVVVADGRAVIGGDPESVAYARQTRTHLISLGEREFAASTRYSFLEMDDESPRFDAVIAEAVRSDPRAVGDAMIELMAIDLRPRMASIKAPLLMLVPDDPQLTWIARSHVAPVPQHKVVVVPNARHFVMIDNPTVYLRAVDAFLAANR